MGGDVRHSADWTLFAAHSFPPPRPPNTRDQLRGVHDLTLVHDDRADHGATIRLQPPLVTWTALFDGASIIRWCHPIGAFYCCLGTPSGTVGEGAGSGGTTTIAAPS